MARDVAMRARVGAASETINLVPIMAILVILIPTLLYAFTFFEVTVQATAAPRLHPPAPGPSIDPEAPPLDLTVLITQAGFIVSHRGDGGKTTIPRRQFVVEGRSKVDYDYPALYTHVRAESAAHPKETRINVGAEMNIPWQVIAWTMDATRTVLTKDGYLELEDYGAARPRLGPDRNGDGVGDPIPMFPDVTFVVPE